MPTSLRHALRSLRRTPAFTAAAILTLALGFGSLAATFAIVHGVLLEPLPYGHADRLVSVGLNLPAARQRHVDQPAGIFYTYQRFARRLGEIGFYRLGNANMWTTGDGDIPERVPAAWLTASTIPVLQVPPLLGRSFTADEDRVQGPNVVILSESVWRARFHAARDVVGKTLYVNSVAREIIGVMPDAFAFPSSDTRLWLPARMDPTVSVAGSFSYSGIARLAAGATAEDAQRELVSVLPRLADAFPHLDSGMPTSTWLEQAQPTPDVLPLRDEITYGIARTLWLLAAAAGLVLFVACANVSNLMLIRADGRRLELAVREALGASRMRIMTHFLAEALVLTTTAGAFALLAAWGAIRALVAFGPADVPRLATLRFDLTTVAFVGVLSVLAAIVCSVVPAIGLRRGTMSISLKGGGRGETAGKSRQHLRTTIAMLQIAVALVVSAGSTLLLRTSHRLHQEHAGFDASRVTTIWTQLPFATYGDSSTVMFYGKLRERVARLAMVNGAGLTTRLPLGRGDLGQQAFRRSTDGRVLSLPTSVVDDGYFSTLGIPLMAGHAFQRPGDQRDGEIIISQRASALMWNDSTGANVIGRQVMLAPSGPSLTVVGVVGDVRDRDLATPPSAMLYLPLAVPVGRKAGPVARGTMALVVRTSQTSTAIVAAVRQIVHELDPTVPIFNVETMSDVVGASTARLTLTIWLMTAAAAITLVLGMIGLYGVIAYTVALRTREFGVRIALGADPSRLARSVAMRGLIMIGGGVAAGLVLYAVAAPFLRAFLYGVTPSDPVTLFGTTLVFASAASLALWLPARRAARVDPGVSLRAE